MRLTGRSIMVIQRLLETPRQEYLLPAWTLTTSRLDTGRKCLGLMSGWSKDQSGVIGKGVQLRLTCLGALMLAAGRFAFWDRALARQSWLFGRRKGGRGVHACTWVCIYSFQVVANIQE